MSRCETECNTLTITADADFKYRVKVRAAILNTSVSAYIKHLVLKDLAEAEKEQTATKEK